MLRPKRSALHVVDGIDVSSGTSLSVGLASLSRSRCASASRLPIKASASRTTASNTAKGVIEKRSRRTTSQCKLLSVPTASMISSPNWARPSISLPPASMMRCRVFADRCAASKSESDGSQSTSGRGPLTCSQMDALFTSTCAAKKLFSVLLSNSWRNFAVVASLCWLISSRMQARFRETKIGGFVGSSAALTSHQQGLVSSSGLVHSRRFQRSSAIVPGSS